MAYEMPAPVTCDGDIQINGREGLVISFRWRDADGEYIDLSARTLVFEVKRPGEEPLRIPLTPGEDEFQKFIIITQEDTDAIYAAGRPNGAPVMFVVRLESVSPPDVPWAGVVTILGYVGEPT